MKEKAPPGSPSASSRAAFPTTPGTSRPHIGSQFIPRQRVHMSTDELTTQRLVLSMRRHREARRQVSNIAAAVLGTTLAVALWFSASAWGAL